MRDPTIAENAIVAPIPEDVMKAAQGITDEALLDVGFSGPDESDRVFHHLSDALARAIMAERERIEALMKDPAAVRINWLRGTVACQHLIDEAVAAERERCARIADQEQEMVEDNDPSEFGRGYELGYRMGCAYIAAAIRKGEA